MIKEPENQPTLENELIKLRPLEKSDFESLFKVAKDPQIWDQHPVKRYRDEVFEEFFEESLNSKGALVVIDKNTGEIIGSSRYHIIEGINDAIEIGWTFLSRDYWGGKYNRALKKLMIEHAFNHFSQVLFYVDQFNFRSQKAVLKLGATIINDRKHRFQSTNPNNLSYALSIENWKD